MVSFDSDGRRRRTSPSSGGVTGYLAYLLGWLIAGAVVAVVAVLLVPGEGEHRPPPDGPPAVRALDLAHAMRDGDCRLRASRPPDGAGPRLLRGGVFDAPLGSRAQGRARARGMIVIEYRGDVAPARVDALEAVQRAAPTATIVAPAGDLGGPALRASAYRRVLSCRHADATALDAVQLFRGRFVGIRAPRAS